MSGYTPGPWAAPKGFPSEVERQDGKTVASCWHENATLIAAAPELLQALRALVAIPENTSPFGGEIQDDRLERTFDNARAAIAKAEGKA